MTIKDNEYLDLPTPRGPMRTYLVRIPHRKGHSIQSNVLLASATTG